MVRLISSLAALGRDLQEVFSVPQDLPNSIARALARLETSTKTNPPHPALDGQSGDKIENTRDEGATVGDGNEKDQN